ncbi:MAG: hypothetical protein H0U57_13670 [Tatlockia sp.]|nr:hypothetical protein [Tatlockia sp.]
MERTTRGSDIQNLAPDTEAIVKLIEITTEPESIDYACTQFDRKMNSLGKEMIAGSQAIKATLEEHRQNVYMQRPSQESQWRGMAPESSYNHYQSGRATLASKNLQANEISDVQVDFALSDSSQFLRAFSSNGQSLDTEVQISVDELLSTYLSKNNLFAEVTPEATIIYENDGNGHIRVDNKGQPVNADPEQVRELLQDSKKGFQSYLKEHGINSNLRARPFPEETPAPLHKETIQQAEAPAKPKKQKPTVEPGPATPSV